MGRCGKGCLGVAVLAAGLLGLGAASAGTAEADGVRRALLIGVNQYQGVPDLRGALNDVELLRSLLVTRYGFREEHVRVVIDTEATRAGILAALEKLAGQAGPEDLVYVHYSGHGSQVMDQNGDEADEADETLVPHDGRTPGVPDVVDDEIAAILDRMTVGMAVIVLDSCHSGTATRGETGFRTRWVPPDERTDLYAAGEATTRAVVPVLESRHVLLSAAAAHQRALDGPVDGRSHGLFSFALGRSLASAAPGANPREILAGIETELGRIKAQLGLADMPEPQLEGPAERLARALLPEPGGVASPATEPPARLPFAAVRATDEAGVVRLVGAARLGAAAGALWSVYPPGEVAFSPGGALAEAEVTQLREPDALARLVPADAEIPPEARAVAAAPPVPERRVPVRWLGQSERAGRLRQALAKRVPELVRVEAGEFARFVVECSDERCDVYGADGRSPVASLTGSDDAVFVAELARIFARSLTASELMAVDNPASALRLTLAVEGGAAEAAGGGDRTGRTRAPRYHIRLPGEPRTPENSLQLRVEASADCFLTLVDLDAEGTVRVLFPNPISETRGYLSQGRIAGSEPVRIPDSLAPGNRAGFHIDYAPPAGTDTLRGFCTTSLEAATTLRSLLDEIATRGTGPAGLRRPLARVASRGLVLVADAPEGGVAAGPDPLRADWTAASLTIQVTEAAGDRTSAMAARSEEVPFLDSVTFDDRLADALKSGAPVVVVRFLAPVSVEALPERLDRWLHAVARRYDGAVTVVPDSSQPATRDAIDLGVSLVLKTYAAIQKQLLYRPARDYDVTVYVLPADNAVSRVEFRRKRSASGSG